ncbi:MAG TPA: aspartyl-phosphate phosphatase Spo0E family protein [Desulfitobacterium dehalogenans]|uniref:Aspartyl-phosphate phosphatase Spo0E family protein n=1 Tax=Desulfitobacterium dehalogenans TaxID=36854 RepID=A0A7C7D4V7_9FIRM|nr:aspartyl-phosphate phosphatase Spo0E family protein [Desulfitobacterium dehalogenans]
MEKRLLKKIEVLRRKLYRYATTRSLVDDEVVELSQELDHLLNQYQRLDKYRQISFW